jgi:HTH-type transcriptional regulator / antitoxin HigA
VSVAASQTPETRNVRGVALYMALVSRFPLRPLRSERDLDRAAKIANELAVRGNLSRWEHDYLDVLSDLIEAFATYFHVSPAVFLPEP